jgi:2-dehydro-3-deoxygalactonokinase
MNTTKWIGVDWGTTGFRLWVMDADGQVLNASQGPFGMSSIKPDAFGRVLEESLNTLGVDEDVPVVICGMAGAAQGWCEAPYLTAPTQLEILGQQAVVVPNTRRCVRILPGVKQMNPANVMRGEETQIAGLLHHRPDFGGTVCLPGTHTKWVRIADRAIASFETCMTGEQFAFFSETSVLSHSMTLDGWSDSAFSEAVRTATRDPAAIARRLFAIRAEMLTAEQTSAEARATLSGLLIGQELMAVPQYWQGQPVTLIGAPTLCEIYLKALDVVDVVGRSLDVASMTLAGLTAAHQQYMSQANA